MNKEPETSCSVRDLVHAWRDITSNVVLASYPLQYPPRQEQCQNCGLVRTYRTRTEEWLEYEVKDLPEGSYGVTIITSGTVK